MEIKNKHNHQYSEEIREILEHEPMWIIRNGMWIIMGIFALALAGFFLFSLL